jgi:SAM-dependent methyltransferase
MTGKARLSAAQAEARYEAERLQGATIAGGHEDAWGWSGPAGRIRAARRAEFLIERGGLAPGIRCLELGAGTGEFTARLAESGCELVALELSEATAAVCRDRVGDRAEVVVGNAETAQGLEGRQFDAIVGVSVLHHLNLDLTLSSTFAALRPGGTFAFSEPNMANPQIWAERHVAAVKRRRHVTEHETAFRARELSRILGRHGLVVDVAEPFEFLHPATPRAWIEAVQRIEGRLERSPLRAIAGSVRVAGRRPERSDSD